MLKKGSIKNSNTVEREFWRNFTGAEGSGGLSSFTNLEQLNIFIPYNYLKIEEFRKLKYML